MLDGYTEQEIAYLINQKETTELTWVEITEKYNKKFKKDRNFESIKKTYQRYKDYYLQDDNHVKTLKDIHRTKKANSYTSKQNKSIIEEWNKRDGLLETIKETVKSISLQKHSVDKRPKKSRKKKNMTLEALVSDVHIGKLVTSIEGNEVTLEVLRRRVRKLSETIVKEINRESKFFNVERLILAMLGDVIENADFHGKESTKGCEFSTSRQVQEAINCLWFDLLLPIAKTGILVDIPCVTGNHDRIDINKTYVKPGEDNLSYIVYNTLRLLAEASGLKNLKFNIIVGLYTHVDVYGNTIVYEHGDEVKGINMASLLNQMNRRQQQIGKVVHFFRMGHYHEPVSYGQGRLMINGSVPGQDSYAESKGFMSEALQILNYYVETNKRSTCFFRSFPIYLQNS